MSALSTSISAHRSQPALHPHTPVTYRKQLRAAGGRRSHLASFIRALIDNPRRTGAAFPSFPALARQMAQLVPQHPSGLILELGPGTGPVTRALLNRGLDHTKLILIERSKQMVQCLVEHFPSLQIIEGDARYTSQLLRHKLGKDHLPVSVIVSSLPLKVLPSSTVQHIADEAYRLLPHGGLVIQFTYDIRRKAKSVYEQCGFHKVGSRIVWANMPPARVDWYRK